MFLPRDAMRKRGLCCRPVSVRLSRWCFVSRVMKISSRFFVDPVAPSFWFLTSSADPQFQRGTLQWGAKYKDGTIFAIFEEIAVCLGNCRR